jgi:exonuclease SbcD
MADGLKVLHTADWHLGRKIEGRNRHVEQEQVLDEICRIAEEEAVDAVVIAGDVFDAYNPPVEAEALFYTTMTRLAGGGRRAVIVIAGNHDSPDRLIASEPYARSLGITTLGYPKDVPPLYDGGSERCSCVEAAPSFVRLRFPGHDRTLALLALPYPSESRLREVLTESIEDEVTATIDYNRRVRSFLDEQARRFMPGEAAMIASHLHVVGGAASDSERQIQVGGIYSVDPWSFPSSAGYAALGHLHRPQEQHGASDLPIRYSGSVLQYSFSEENQTKEVTLVEYDRSGKAAYRSIPLGAGRKLRHWKEVAGTDELEQRLAGSDPSLYLSITLLLDEPLPLDYMLKLRAAHPNILQCLTTYRRDERLMTQVGSIRDLPIGEQFQRFVQSRYDEPVGDDVMRLFLELTGTPDPEEE